MNPYESPEAEAEEKKGGYDYRYLGVDTVFCLVVLFLDFITVIIALVMI